MHACMLETKPTPESAHPLSGKMHCFGVRLRSCLIPAAWHHAVKAIYSEKGLAAEIYRQITTCCCFVIHPYSCFRFYWDCWILIIYFASLIYIPWKLFLPCPQPHDRFIIFCDLIGLLFIIISFVTGYVDEDGKKIILEPTKIAMHYLKGTFIFDVISCLPLQYIKFENSCDMPMFTVLYLFKLPRFVHVVRANEQVCRQCKLSYMQATFSCLIITGILFFHWLTFIHYQTPLLFTNYYEHEGLYLHWLQRFKVIDEEGHQVNAYRKYVTNLYYAAGIAIGTGVFSVTGINVQLVPELCMSMFIALVGLMFLTFCITTIFRLLMYKFFEKYTFYGRITEVQKYLESRVIPERLREKIYLYINYRFNGHYFHEKFIWSTVNVQIKQEVNMFFCKKLLLNVPLFQDMPIALINTVIYSLNQLMYLPGEIVVKYGSPGSALYLISSGTVAVMDAENREVGHLKDGAYFGEHSLLKPGTPRTATVIALEITEIYKLTHHQFLKCLQPCPRLKRRLFEDPDFALRRKSRPSKQPPFAKRPK